ncbi:MAG: leucine-rich repeat domain-containing protein [Clostridia bacterium]|nr:leucine-rich repeat domain-containing protein [Clostridia bacterium]
MQRTIKFTGVILTFIIVCFCSLFIFAGCGICDERYYTFKEISGGYSIAKKSDYELSGTRTLPNTHLGKPVTEIAKRGFTDCNKLTRIIIPDNIKVINESAFEGCGNLTSVTIGEGIETIEESAFSDCKKLIEVQNFSNIIIQKNDDGNGGVAKHAKNVYTANFGNSKLVDKDNFTFYVDDDIFLVGYNGEEKSLILPDDYDGKPYSIYMNAFYANKELGNVVIPDKVCSIGEGAFQGSSITSVTFNTPSNWSVVSPKGVRIELKEEKLSDSITAAQYLRIDYYEYDWKRTE